MLLSKSTQVGRFGKKKQPTGKISMSESELQEQVSDYLLWKKIKNFHIPNSVWRWLKLNAEKICTILSRGTSGRHGSHNNGLGGCPDVPCFIRLGKKYNLNLMLELKSQKGQLHGKQKKWASDIAVQIPKDPDTAMAVINKFEEIAEIIKKVCEEKGIEL